MYSKQNPYKSHAELNALMMAHSHMYKCGFILRYRVGGYDVPKDTMVIMNIWSIHHDPNTWTDPFKFKPGKIHGDRILMHTCVYFVMPFLFFKFYGIARLYHSFT